MAGKYVENLSIAVAGHLVVDEIIRPDGEETFALGGISYNLAALLSVMKTGRIIPVCEIGDDIRAHYNSALGDNEVMDNSAVTILPQPNVVNRLVYNSNGNRDEWNSRVPGRLSLARIADDIDALLLNFISGDDVGIEDLLRFKKNSGCLIYCDYHSLALGRDKTGRRYYREHPRWKRYLAHVDMVQMNLMELATLTGDNPDNPKEVAAGCISVHSAGPATVIVTMGGKGVVISTGGGRWRFFIPPFNIHAEVDPTGCGDTFASVFLYNYLLTREPLESAKIAAGFAAAKATFSGIDGFRAIVDIVGGLKPIPEPIKI